MYKSDVHLNYILKFSACYRDNTACNKYRKKKKNINTLREIIIVYYEDSTYCGQKVDMYVETGGKQINHWALTI